MNSKKNLKPILTVTSVVIIVCVVAMLSYVQGMRDQYKAQSSNPNDYLLDKIKSVPNKDECYVDVNFSDSSYSVYPYDEYIVASGDSLMSISRELLGDDTRANEFILLNEDRYPTLISQSSYLERGWKLRIPPKDIIMTGGFTSLKKYFGHLVYIAEDQMALRNQPKHEGFFLYPNRATTKYYDGDKEITQNKLTTDKCVEVVLGPEGVNTPEYVRIVR